MPSHMTDHSVLLKFSSPLVSIMTLYSSVLTVTSIHSWQLLTVFFSEKFAASPSTGTCVSMLNHSVMPDSSIPWIVACQDPLSMVRILLELVAISSSRVPCQPGMEFTFPALPADSLPLSHLESHTHTHTHIHIHVCTKAAVEEWCHIHTHPQLKMTSHQCHAKLGE